MWLWWGEWGRVGGSEEMQIQQRETKTRQRKSQRPREAEGETATETSLKEKDPIGRHTDPTCSHLKPLSPALGALVATQLTGSPWCPGRPSSQRPEAPNVPRWVPLQLCGSGEATGCPGPPDPTRSWPV